MKKKKENPAPPQEEKKDLPGDPVYGPGEDIYNNAKKESFKNDDRPPLSEGLDVPGSELDDADEKIGEEDEENNYYSIGGDAHTDLDENEGEK